MSKILKTITSGSVIEKIIYTQSENKEYIGTPEYPRFFPKDGGPPLRPSVNRQSEHIHESINDLTHLIHSNFNDSGVFVTLTYSNGNDEDLSRKKAEESFRHFVRRVKYSIKKYNKENHACFTFRYIYITSDIAGKTGEAARFHHHMITDANCVTFVIDAWNQGHANVQNFWTTNSDRYPIAKYMIEQTVDSTAKKRFRCSVGLEPPEIKYDTYYGDNLNEENMEMTYDSKDYHPESSWRMIRLCNSSQSMVS